MAVEDARAVRAALRDDLVAAMKARRREAVSALRTAIAAIDNAEAIDAPRDGQPTASGPIAGARSGLGVTEAARRELAVGDVFAILRAQVDERTAEAERYDALGQPAAAERLRAEADTLAKYLPG